MNDSRGIGRPIDILLVEDSIEDARLTQEAFQEAKIWNNLFVVRDGEEALGFLRKERQYDGMPRPDIILLDLNLPKMNGDEVLARIKQDPSLRRIPVVILTTSRSDDDIVKTYDLHANCYVNKPVDLEQFIEVVRSIEGFWLTFVKLPPC